MRLSPTRAFLKVEDWRSPPKGSSINAVLFSPGVDGQEPMFLFQVPSDSEAKKSRDGLRLFGGMRDEKDADLFETLRRELKEEICGEEPRRTNKDQPRAEAIIDNAVDRLKANPGIVPPPDIRIFWPDRANPEQDDWWKSKTHIIGVPVSRESLFHLAKVVQETAAIEKKEVKDVEILPQQELTHRLRTERTFAHFNERAGVVQLLQGIAPGESAGIPLRFTAPFHPFRKLDFAARNG